MSLTNFCKNVLENNIRNLNDSQSVDDVEDMQDS